MGGSGSALYSPEQYDAGPVGAFFAPEIGECLMSAIARPHADARITRLTLQRIMRDFGEVLTVIVLDDHAFQVTTPFSFASGEMFPLVFETRDAGWRITDRGHIVESRAREVGELSDHQLNEIAEIVRSSGVRFSESHQIYADYDELPTPAELAHHIQVEAVVGHLLQGARVPSASA